MKATIFGTLFKFLKFFNGLFFLFSEIQRYSCWSFSFHPFLMDSFLLPPLKFKMTFSFFSIRKFSYRKYGLIFFFLRVEDLVYCFRPKTQLLAFHKAKENNIESKELTQALFWKSLASSIYH